MNTIAPLLRNLLPIAVSFGVVFASAAEVRAPSGPALPRATAAAPPASPNLDSMVTEILKRPLFSPSRQAAGEAPSEAPTEEVKEPPKMPGRLAGVAILPEVREALFESDGEKPVAVKEGQEIEGWVVASIKADQVVLRSAMGEQIVKPADGAGVRRVAAGTRRPQSPAQANNKAGPAQAGRNGPVIPTKTQGAPAGVGTQPVRSPAAVARTPQTPASPRIGR